jgi:hypothetical protein
MKMKSMLLIMIIIVMIPEILLTAFIFGRYTTNLGFPEVSTNVSTAYILSFLMSNPLFFIIVIVVFIVVLILYFTLQMK